MSDVNKAVFLSYAREDAEAARRIADALRAFGVEVWFDQNELRGGDAWDAKIKKQIRECTLFVPVVSARTQERPEGYFRREWKLAVERTNDMAAGVAFIVPVVIDETAEGDAAVPDEFLRVQWMRLPGALPSPQFVEQVKRLLGAPRGGRGRRTEGGGQSSEAGGQRPDAGQHRSSSFAKPTEDRDVRGQRSVPARRGAKWWVVAATTLAIVIAAYFALRPRAAQPSASAGPNAVATPASAAAKPPLDFASAKSIAVLPFTNMSDEKDSTFFSDGVHEDILTNIALIRELRVVSRTSVLEYRNATKKMRQIASELGVNYILEGSVRRAGNTVRVTGQLIDARTDEHLWAKSYDRELKDVFAIQTALAQEIAAALKAVLSPGEKKLLERRPTENPAAYDLYLKARELLRGPGPVTSEVQVTLLQAAVEFDPKFAAAWAQLSFCHGWLYFFDQDHTPGRIEKAKAALAVAVRLAPESPEAMRAVGDYSYYCLRDFARAGEQYRAIVRLQPNYSDVYRPLSAIHRRQGRWKEALEASQIGVQLDPGDHFGLNLLALLLERGRRYDEARPVRQSVVRARPESIAVQFDLARLSFMATGSTREVAEMFAGLSATQGRSIGANRLRRRWALMTGDLTEFLALEDEKSSLASSDPADSLPESMRTAGAGSSLLSSAIVLIAKGDMAGARARLAQIETWRARLQTQPENGSWLADLSAAEALLGIKEAAVRHARKAVELVPESRDASMGPIWSANLAFVYAWTGDKDRAITEYARLLRTPFSGLNVHEMKKDPRYHPLRGDPRFEALLNDPKNNAPLY